MKKDMKFFIKLFTSTLSLSAFTFGGGYVIIPLMRKRFVEDYQWIDEKEMLDLTAIAQSSPGAMAVNAAILIGYRLAGVFGALITIIGTVLPPLIILSVISVAYTAFISNQTIQFILRGMQAAVAAVVIDVGIGMMIELIKEKKVLPVVVMVGAFSATFFFHVNAALIILVCGILGVSAMYYLKFRNKRAKSS